MVINYLKDVKAIRLNISPTDSHAKDKANLLKTNFIRMQIPIEPFITNHANNNLGLFSNRPTYYSSELCYLITLNNLRSIDEIKNNLLQGFSQINEHNMKNDIHSRPMQYRFETKQDERNIIDELRHQASLSESSGAYVLEKVMNCSIM